MSRDSRQLLYDLIHQLGSPKWDLLIVGDGSGSGWDGAAGWAATLVENRQVPLRRFFYGGCDSGSVNLAESMPYLQSLTWYDTYHGKERLRKTGLLNVHIVTDSQTVAKWGTNAMSAHAELPRKMLALWSGMRELRRLGYNCQFHWLPRQTTELNWVADLIAGLSRGAVIHAKNSDMFKNGDVAKAAASAISSLVFYDPETEEPLSPYNYNPVTSPIPYQRT